MTEKVGGVKIKFLRLAGSDRVPIVFVKDNVETRVLGITKN